jgi:flagellar basal body rod protein FlgG
LDSRFRIQDSGFRIQDSGFKIQDSGFRIQDSGFRITINNDFTQRKPKENLISASADVAEI